ncbi:Mitochondrial ribosome small subunit biogenesis protein [Sporothrix stenoceras]|uniref:Mitochondrial ribosome small subunit biogenesis protein n=1 Tax=Sporothrix stenoceras TaxID=5173 RepID=A0ABR3YHA0_9PEZI
MVCLRSVIDIDSIRETIAESPYKYNHVYHVLDAADFPMSLLPRISSLLGTMPLRSRNRRSQPGKFIGGRRTELSFVITRADLLAPRRDQIDKLMPWIRDTLRDALGRLGRKVRLGNVRCVSARRNWWTPELKEEIWDRGGANWLVGKANVGKSYLVHHVFPKGRMDTADAKKPLLTLKKKDTGHYGLRRDHGHGARLHDAGGDAGFTDMNDDGYLLPPRPQETNYPQMPVVSALPGTTASPIRIPFGNGKGELIDLPGLERTALIDYVEESKRDSLVMKTRMTPEQVTLKGPWQSLLLGGFIRITPRTPDLVFLAYNFTPLDEHKTMTEKAIGIQTQTSDLRVQNISAPGTGGQIALAGSFQLKYDVTKIRAGPITRKDAANIDIERLPYRVVALDILIEGCGWVEVVAQVRTRNLFKYKTVKKPEPIVKKKGSQVDSNGILQSLDLSDPDEAGPEDTAPNASRETEAAQSETQEIEMQWPEIDVYSPGGKFIGSRRPLNAWMLAQPKTSDKKKMRPRPKPSMKGAKKREKAARRATLGSEP